MEQPGRLLSLFKNVQSSKTDSKTGTSVTGNADVDEVICTLGGSDLAKLLRYVRDWNTNAKTSGVAQTVLFAAVKLRSADDMLKAFKDEMNEAAFAEVNGATKGTINGGTGMRELVDALIPYTERHLARLDRLVQESYMVDYILGEMDDGMFDGDVLDDELYANT